MKITFVPLLALLANIPFCHLPDQTELVETTCLPSGFRPPEVIWAGGKAFANPCQYVLEGQVLFAEGWAEVNCRRLPIQGHGMQWQLDTLDIRGRPHLAIQVLTPGFSGWCQRDFFLEQAGCPYRSLDLRIPEIHRPGATETGFAQFVMEPGFERCFDPGKPLLFRLTASARWPL